MIYVVVISLIIIGLYATAFIPARRGKGKKTVMPTVPTHDRMMTKKLPSKEEM